MEKRLSLSPAIRIRTSERLFRFLDRRIVLVTGDSSGFGLEIVKEFLRHGDQVYGISRRPFSYPGLVHLQADLTKAESLQEAVNGILEKEGRIDILINDAGYGIFSSVEETPIDEAKKLFDVNVLGALRMCQSVLPSMRRNHGGLIINISSIGAETPLPFQGFYSAYKSAMDMLFDSMRSEVRPFGIRIASLRPGDSRTGFTSHRKTIAKEGSSYESAFRHCLKQVESDEKGGFSPSKVGRKAYSISCRRRPKGIYRVGFKDRFLLVLFKALPKRLAYYILFRIYCG